MPLKFRTILHRCLFFGFISGECNLGVNCKQLLHIWASKITIEFLSSEFKYGILVSVWGVLVLLGIYENGSLVLLDLLVGCYICK